MSGNNPTSENATYLARAAGYEVDLPSTPHSENAEYLAEVIERLEALSHIGRYLSTWNCTTGLPSTNPSTTPYTFHTGDYFVVGTVAASGGTNYKPNGTSYTGAASTTVDASTIAIGDMYRFDGTVWELLKFSDVLSQYQKKTEKKTAMDATAVANSEYMLGTQTAVSFALPTGTMGDEIVVVFYSGSTATTLTVTGTYLGSLPTPEANQRIELNFLYDGYNWAVLSHVQAVES